ncbi:acyl-CoA dehydrogenase family protein [Streptomyces sp. NBC_00257]|uniref:acyl-CoA dehydrogenase family protein n=1 Tax=unclassified Streptomyces TaxID=2593676 RepID=UPI002256707B|nr:MULTISPECIES: acyl-CoA dehydrogenase family protein [unclassified Streptomyces]WTB59758.1 acyl-CoA dehydrogenase family protein [Streptomyces sp. NBC_00826]WTH95652.1 acyl-CoA dehydrogenase family protein [Streptomyces sp. NBC_00825]WTI04381.1 acyl-CoA dehydrogenase family protein [Streptomyces sp. NBC_00822]MCX4865794.1 acyl-CoA dehydrogenase family protein [Streptomyces sp. NBC_00906]MCX4897033.1 acyl-CoA dehydrogenase family protein [Streptomyces sp. NBC_00892]
MHLAQTERQQQLRAELRTYFREVMPGRDAGAAPGAEDPAEQRRVLRRIGADGMLGLGWPVEYGGQGRGADEQFVFFDEAYRAGAPVSMVTLNTVGPTLMKYGTDEQKAYFLPRILSGELVFAIGYSEPEAGTDLASMRTRAVRDRGDAAGPDGAGDGGHWVIDGQKIFTSNAQNADWIWLACRTDPEAPKHQGISIILVPTDSPGFSWTPIETVGGLTTTATYYDGIRVPATNLVGPENGGWGLITNQLNHERVALAAIGMQAEDFYRAALAHALTPDPVTGRRPADEPWVRGRLAEAYARLAATRLLNWRLVGEVGAGSPAPGEASGVKFAGTESAVEVYRMCQEITGEAGMVRGGSPGAFGDGELERMNRAAQINTFGGGVSEVQREIVATMRLGMKRGRR